MKGSLWYLTRLRFGASWRRWQRSLARPKGILITVAVALMFLPSVAGVAVFVIHPPPSPIIGQVVRFGPLMLLAFTLFSLATTSGGTGLYFTPAEIDFLFPGPFHRRQLLTYKLVVTALGIGLTSLFIGTMGAVTARWALAALLATFLMFMFLHLIQTTIGLLFNYLGALVWRRGVRWGAAVVLVGAVLIVMPSADRLAAQDWPALGLAAEASPIGQAVLTPFRWFVLAYSAPDLATLALYGGLALGVDAALVAAIFLLDAGFLEAAANSSAQRLAKVQRIAQGGGAIRLARKKDRLQLRLPNLPWLGGAGPNLWRQLTGALGNPTLVLGMIAVAGGLAYVFTVIFTRSPNSGNQAMVAGFISGTGMPLIIFLSLFLAYDFRGDLDVMETLKMLPIRPTRLALGQVLAPTLLSCLIQLGGCLGVILALGGFKGHAPALAAVLLFLAPVNFLFYLVENLLFLWYPTRMVAGQFNGVAAVRQVLVLMAKLLVMGLTLGVAFGLGMATYFVSGFQLIPALAVGWITLAAIALALLPLLGRAFDRFDIGVDTPA